MDKNTVIGMLLMCAVIFGFMYINQPSEAELAAQRQQDSIAQVEKAKQQTAATVADTLSANDLSRLKDALRQIGAANGGKAAIDNNGVKLQLAQGDVIEGSVAVEGGKQVEFNELLGSDCADAKTHNQAVDAVKAEISRYAQNGSFASCMTGTEQIVKLKNDVLEIELSTKGGMLSRASLLDYKAFNAPKVEVFSPGDNYYSFILNGNSQSFDTRNYYFTPSQLNDSTVEMTLNLAGGAQWGLRYTLLKGSYMVRMQVIQKNMAQVIPTNIPNMDFKWHQKMSRHEEGKMFEERNSGLYFKYVGESGSVENLKENGEDSKTTQDQIKWISTKNQFFSAVLIADNNFTGANLTSAEIKKDSPDYNKYLKVMDVTTQVPYSSSKANPASFYFYFGPNKYNLLSSYDKYSPNEDLKLTNLIPLGWKWLRWINTGIIIPVFNWLGKYVSNYGIIILILTLLLKIVLSPLTYKSYISQAKMRVLAPDIKAINDKYPGQENAMKRQQKTMELYSQAGASPFGGCLPMLLQMPILIAMFWFFPSCIELRGQAFLWAKDLSAPDAIVSWNAQIPFITNYFGNHISLFCMLMTVTNIVYTYLSMQSQQQSQQMPGMKWMMYLMPLMFLVFFNNYASGLSYYYFISLLITIAQTYSSRLIVTEEKVRAKIAENAKKPKKKSGFMARLEEAQRQQQAALREQEKRKKKQQRS